MSLVSGIKLINETVKELTEKSGVYKMLNINGDVMYVGKAKNLAKRVSQYAQIERLPNRLRLMVSLLNKIEVLITKSEEEALLLEAQLIKGLQPKFNIALKDDKSFPYITIDNTNQFPRIFKYRGIKKEKHSYFGPFLNTEDLENLILIVQKLFKLRSCTDTFFYRRQRPCLLYQINRCSAPCVGKADEQEYQSMVKAAKKFLSGDILTLRKKLIASMEAASIELKFEKAAEIRDTIQLLNQLRTENLYSENGYYNIDIFAVSSTGFRHAVHVFSIREGSNFVHENLLLESIEQGDEFIKTFLLNFYAQKTLPKIVAINYTEAITAKFLEKLLNAKIIQAEKNKSVDKIYSIAKKNSEFSLSQDLRNELASKEILEQLYKLIGIKYPIHRIEIYDNSHIQGKYAIGCMVVHDGIQFMKEEYRVFKINRAKGGNDYSMMQEMLSRRLKKFNVMPDLLLIDGGLNHLKVAISVLKGLEINGIRVMAIAKGIKRNAGKETLYLDDGQFINLAENDQTLHYLQRLRDEAHRFAITMHRKLRNQGTITSLTTAIPGIGAKRQKVLLTIFGSYEKIQQASLKELQKIPNFGKNFASKVYSYLHSKKDG